MAVGVVVVVAVVVAAAVAAGVGVAEAAVAAIDGVLSPTKTSADRATQAPAIRPKRPSP